METHARSLTATSEKGSTGRRYVLCHVCVQLEWWPRHSVPASPPPPFVCVFVWDVRGTGLDYIVTHDFRTSIY